MKGGRQNLALENGRKRGSIPSNQGNSNVGLIQRNKAGGAGAKRVDKTRGKKMR